MEDKLKKLIELLDKKQLALSSQIETASKLNFNMEKNHLHEKWSTICCIKDAVKTIIEEKGSDFTVHLRLL